jgi:hypothetical protein
MSLDVKKLALKVIEESGGFEYTREVLKGLFVELEGMLDHLEVEAGVMNSTLGTLLQKIKI